MATVYIEGLEDLEKNIAFLGKSLTNSALRRSGMKAMLQMYEEAKRLAPYDRNDKDGIHLRNDLKLSSKLVKGKVVIRIGTTRKTQLYARVMEYGRYEFSQTRHFAYGKRVSKPYAVTIKATEPRPFLRPAFHRYKQHTIDEFKILIRTAITKAVKAKVKRERKKNS